MLKVSSSQLLSPLQVHDLPTIEEFERGYNTYWICKDKKGWSTFLIRSAGIGSREMMKGKDLAPSLFRFGIVFMKSGDGRQSKKNRR